MIYLIEGRITSLSNSSQLQFVSQLKASSGGRAIAFFPSADPSESDRASGSQPDCDFPAMKHSQSSPPAPSPTRGHQGLSSSCDTNPRSLSVSSSNNSVAPTSSRRRTPDQSTLLGIGFRSSWTKSQAKSGSTTTICSTNAHAIPFSLSATLGLRNLMASARRCLEIFWTNDESPDRKANTSRAAHCILNSEQPGEAEAWVTGFALLSRSQRLSQQSSMKRRRMKSPESLATCFSKIHASA